mgnify:CR=1 FL=1
MPQDRICNRKIGRSLLARAALGAALAAVMVCANTAAVRAGDDDPDGASVISTIMHSLGFKAGGETYGGIDYNERSPLVVPPTRDLPPPVSSNAPPAPNWPKDADIERAKQAKKDDKPRYQRDYVIESSRPLRPNELATPGAPKTNASGNADSTANSTMTNPRDTGAKKNLFSGLFAKKEEYTTFTGEPARDALTDPPPGYLTPSPDQPYGISEAKAKYKIPTLGERVEPTR